MMKKSLGLLLFSLVVAGIGAVGGYFARQLQDQAAADAAAAEDDDHEDHDPELDEATLATLGIRSGVAELGSHTVAVRVQAVVEDPGLGDRRLVAPFGGVVTVLPRRPGEVVGQGEVVVVLTRDDIPRRELAYTAPLLPPLDEELHELFVALRRESHRVKLAVAERDRLARLYGDGTAPLVGQEALFRAEQNLARAEQAVDWHSVRAPLPRLLRGADRRDRRWSASWCVTWASGFARWNTTGSGPRAVRGAYEALPESIRTPTVDRGGVGGTPVARPVHGRGDDGAMVEESALRANFVDVARISSLLERADRRGSCTWLGREPWSPWWSSVRPMDREDWDVRELSVRIGDRVAARGPCSFTWRDRIGCG